MSPPIESWSAQELEDRVQVNMKGKRRKDKIDLQQCELLEMLQYECEVEGSEKNRTRYSKVVCRPVERLFRRCKDRNGTFVVETTAWEERYNK